MNIINVLGDAMWSSCYGDDLEDSGENTLESEYDFFAMAKYVVVMRVDEGTMGHIGNILFQKHSLLGCGPPSLYFSKVEHL